MVSIDATNDGQELPHERYRLGSLPRSGKEIGKVGHGPRSLRSVAAIDSAPNLELATIQRLRLCVATFLLVEQGREQLDRRADPLRVGTEHALRDRQSLTVFALGAAQVPLASKR